VRVDVLFSSVICVSKVVILCMCRYCVFFSNLCFQQFCARVGVVFLFSDLCVW